MVGKRTWITEHSDTASAPQTHWGENKSTVEQQLASQPEPRLRVLLSLAGIVSAAPLSLAEQHLGAAHQDILWSPPAVSPARLGCPQLSQCVGCIALCSALCIALCSALGGALCRALGSALCWIVQT